MEEIIKILTERNKTISTMESCTGGALASAITNIKGSSEIFKFGAVTYSNEYKIKMGVSKEIIDTYSVYSIETAREMAKKISDFSDSDYGIGITGKLNRIDPYNNFGNDNKVFISVYNKKNNKYNDISIFVNGSTRKESKKEIICQICEKLLSVLKEDN